MSVFTTPHASDARLRALVSPFVGIVNGIYDKFYLPDDARLAYIFCKAARSSGIIDGGRDVSFDGNGAHFTRDAAIASAIGEAVERYCGGAIPDHSKTCLSAFDALSEPAVPPEDFALFHPTQHLGDQISFLPFTRQSVVRWISGERIGDGAPYLLPLQMSYLQDLPGRDEQRIGYVTSSGLACGTTVEEATLGGLLELIERDAFMLTWLHRCSLPRINVASDPVLAELEQRYFAPAGLVHHVIDMSVFLGIPSVLAIVWNDRHPDGVAFACGAAAATTMQRAVGKALVEAYHCRAWARELRIRDRERRFLPDFSDILTFNDHVSMFARPEFAKEAAFLFQSSVTRDVADCVSVDRPTVGECVTEIVNRLSAQGVDTYRIDQTTPDIRQAGLRVVRVVAPQLVKLNSKHRNAFLGGDRLYDAPVRVGIATARRSIEDLNPLPHPFP